MRSFLEECCIIGEIEKITGGVLYKAYRAWATETGEYVRSNRDFGEALRVAGFEMKHTKIGNEWRGLTLSADRAVGTTAEEDFLR